MNNIWLICYNDYISVSISISIFKFNEAILCIRQQLHSQEKKKKEKEMHNIWSIIFSLWNIYTIRIKL